MARTNRTDSLALAHGQAIAEASPAEAALAADRYQRARAAFAAGYAAACGTMSHADQRRLRERMARWLEVQRG